MSAMAIEIAPEKVAHVIIKAREYDAEGRGVERHARGRRRRGGSERHPRGLRQRPDARRDRRFIDGLNYDEQANLVALAWIGRGTFEKEELDEAVETARAERINATANYLLGIPLLADYLEEGLEKLGYSVDDIESDVL